LHDLLDTESELSHSNRIFHIQENSYIKHLTTYLRCVNPLSFDQYIVLEQNVFNNKPLRVLVITRY